MTFFGHTAIAFILRCALLWAWKWIEDFILQISMPIHIITQATKYRHEVIPALAGIHEGLDAGSSPA
jgi:hypothetical protein